MTIDKSGQWWRGTEAADIEEYLGAFSASNYPVARIVHARCAKCDGSVFSIRIDDDEGCAQRTCVNCGDHHLMLDSNESIEDANLDDAACPCGNESFEAAVGFAHTGSGDIKWVYLGLRCTADDVLGVYTDWKIDYLPADHLYQLV